MPTQVTNYQCPGCTGPLHFVGASGKLECEYCGASYDVAEIEALYAEKEDKAAAAQQVKSVILLPTPEAGNAPAESSAALRHTAPQPRLSKALFSPCRTIPKAAFGKLREAPLL